MQRFAIRFAFDGLGRRDCGVQRGLHAAELLNEFDGSFVADAGRAGNIVDGVAAQGHHIDDALGRNAEDGLDSGGIENEVVLGRVEDADLGRDELHHVLVGGDDEDAVAERGELRGERADDIVCLEALVAEDGDAEGLQRAADVGELLDEVGGRLGAVGLVAGVVHLVELLRLRIPPAQRLHLTSALVAEDRAVQVVDGGQKLRSEILAQLVDHVDEDIGGRGGDAGARGHGALALHGVIGAEDEGHRIEKIDGRLDGRCFGGGGFSCHRRLRIPSPSRTAKRASRKCVLHASQNRYEGRAVLLSGRGRRRRLHLLEESIHLFLGAGK